MLTTDRDTQLDELLGTSIAGFDIPEDVYLRAVARYEDVGAWLANYWVESPVDGLVYPQGSFPLGTVVQPVDPRGTYDIDLVCLDILPAIPNAEAVPNAILLTDKDLRA